jgi:pyridoxal phosphate enzyme (YggS family)
MTPLQENLEKLKSQIPGGVTLVAVSKKKSNALILEAYSKGQRIFGENYVQELDEKQAALPKDIAWHFIGHLQSNKVKYIAPFVSLIHGVDNFKLLEEIHKQGVKHNRKIKCLLQVHIAQEESKFGCSPAELKNYLAQDHWKKLEKVEICGLMAMASNTEDEQQIRHEFRSITKLFNDIKRDYFASQTSFSVISTGMSGDWKIAVEEGSTMIRIGSAIFGERN